VFDPPPATQLGEVLALLKRNSRPWPKSLTITPELSGLNATPRGDGSPDSVGSTP